MRVAILVTLALTLAACGKNEVALIGAGDMPPGKFVRVELQPGASLHGPIVLRDDNGKVVGGINAGGYISRGAN